MSDMDSKRGDFDVDTVGAVIVGGSGNMGLNRLGQPYPASNIGSGPDVMAKLPDDYGKRKGTSFVRNERRTRERTDQRMDRR